jgi:hypothetical protein
MTGICPSRPAARPLLPARGRRAAGAARLCAALGLLAGSLAVPPGAAAGGGPETTLLVVNADSPLSLRVANEYARLRQIPETHAVWLSGVPSLAAIDVATFRERVLGPIQAYLARHGLEAAVDTIAYSADFPYAVNFSAEVAARGLSKDRFRGEAASLTGLTYFGRRVAAGDLGYLGRNHYFRANLVSRGVPRREPTAEDARRLEEAQRALADHAYARAAEGYRRLLSDYPWAARAWFDLARSLAALGDTEGALQALAGAADHGWAQPLATRTDRLLTPLASHPGFAAVVERMQAAAGTFESARGFRSRYVWGSSGGSPRTEPADSLDRYYLAVMLAYTGVQGNALPEVLAYLGAAAASDGTAPDGSVYLMANPNVRSVTRERFFTATADALRERGRRAQVLQRGVDGQDGIVPIDKPDVIGAVIGARRFHWERSRSRLLPGAIAESLTSYGADFDRPKQTKLSELLRHGAAGSSGTVQEPFAIQAKFPVAYLHVHYADGCSLAEAFYQSVERPYQLLVVGDPLARPFARLTAVGLASPAPDSPWSGMVAVVPRVAARPGAPLGAVELWVDGRPIASARPAAGIPWDTRGVEDGVHELRLVAVEATPIETRSFGRWQVRVANHGLQVTVEGPERVRLGAALALSGRADGAELVRVLQGTRELAAGAVAGGGWRLEVPSLPLGTGPVTLHVRASWPDGRAARSAPLAVWVDEPARVAPGLPPPSAPPGLQLRVRSAGGEEEVRALGPEATGLRRLFTGRPGPASARLEGTFEVGAPGFYQLALGGEGAVRVEVDGATVARAEPNRAGDVFVPLGLASGRHALVVEWAPPGDRVPRVVLAGEGPARALLDP